MAAIVNVQTPDPVLVEKAKQWKQFQEDKKRRKEEKEKLDAQRKKEEEDRQALFARKREERKNFNKNFPLIVQELHNKFELR